MPTLDSSYGMGEPIKLMLIGHSGAGKTGALTSLVKEGYKLRIMDLDKGLTALFNHVQQECPDKLGNISYMTFRDKFKATPMGIRVAGAPKAYVNAVQALDKWEDGSDPSEWGQDTVFVLDSLTALGQAAFYWAKQMHPDFKDPRLWYAPAQESVEVVIANLTAEAFKSHVIVISHIDLREQQDKTVKGFASSIGQALGPKLPRYFNTWLLSEPTGSGKSVKRKIKTLPTGLIDLKNPAPMRIEAEYPIETGLATLFRQLREEKE